MNFSKSITLSMLLMASIVNSRSDVISVKWPFSTSSREDMSVSNSYSKPIINGQVQATVSSSSFYIRNYNGPVIDGEKVSSWWPSTDNGATYSPWQNESTDVEGRYVEFSVSPLNGNSYKFSSVSMLLGGGGTSYIHANIYYSTDGFTTRTKLTPGDYIRLPQLSDEVSMDYVNYEIDAPISDQQTLSIRVYPFFMRSSSSVKTMAIADVIISGNDDNDEISLPQLTTDVVTDITSSTAIAGGSLISDGGAVIVQKGLCWSTQPEPSIESVHGTKNGAGTESFSQMISSLKGGTKYYIRSYATNSKGTGYGPQVEFETKSLLAFPGAEGFGKHTIGGRGGRVVEVTNLNDSGEGSLRYALEDVKEPRTVVFRVSGTIDLKSQITIKHPFVTIAGQTAPGDGICIKNYPLYINTNQVILRYFRSRLGDAVVNDIDAISLVGAQNLMIDHCSFSWSIDAVADFTDGTGNSTMQWSIISEALGSENHSKGYHSMGGSWDGMYGGTYHHNLLISCNSRMPRLDGAVTPNVFGVDQRDLVDIYNNVIYNWGSNSGYGGENTDVNFRNNYMKYGPSTRVEYRNALFGPNGTCSMFVDGNYMYGYDDITADNKKGISTKGSDFINNLDLLFRDSPLDVVEGEIEPATSAYENVLKYVGANLSRDAVDNRLISEVRNNGGAIPVSQSQVGGWPELVSTPAPVDSDKDGMPDEWEIEMKLDPQNPADGNNIDIKSGYTMLEVYLNSLCKESGFSSIQQHVSNDNKLEVFTGSDKINIQYFVSEFSDVSISLHDLTGRLVNNIDYKKQVIGSNNICIDKGTLQQGIYIIKMDITPVKGKKTTLVRKSIL